MFISALTCYCPKRKKITELEDFDEDLRKTALVTGAKKICVAEGASSVDLAVKAIKSILKTTNISKSKIQLILTTGSTPRDEDGFPLSTMLQDHLKAKEAICLGISEVYCAGFHAALLLTKKFFETSNIQTALIVVSDKLRYHCIKPMTIFSDNASAILLTKNNGKIKVLSSQIFTMGKYHDLHYYNLKKGGFFLKNKEKFGKISNKIIFEGIEKLLNNSLKSISMEKKDIDFFIFDNLTRPFEKKIRSKFNDIKEKILPSSYSEYGHLGATDTIFTLHHLLKNKSLKRKNIIISIASGMGITFGCSIFQYKGG